MTKEDILHHFQDINFYYNDCMMYADLSGMLDDLIAENEGFLNFLYQVIPPNEMEKYREMYNCRNDKNNC